MKTIQEYFIDLLYKTQLFEMAECQKDCERIVKNQTINILENLVLINYFRISGIHTTNIEHWKKELIAALYNASKFNMKKDKSKERRFRIVQRAFDERDMKDYDTICIYVQSKFEDEAETQYYTNKRFDEWFDQAVIATINQMDDIISLIVDRVPSLIRDWVNKL